MVIHLRLCPLRETLHSSSFSFMLLEAEKGCLDVCIAAAL